MTIKKKILAGYGVTIVITFLVLLLAVSNLVALGEATNAILSENYRSILAAGNMLEALEGQNSAILLLFLGQARTGIDQFRTHEATFLKWLAKAQDNITIPGEAGQVGSIKTEFTAFCQLFNAHVDLQNPDLSLKDPGVFQKEVSPAFVKVKEACLKLRDLNEGVMYSSSDRARSMAQRAIWSTSLMGFAAMLFSLFFSFFLAGKIVLPLKRLMQASRQISSGDYIIQIPVDTNDELGRLACEFNQMASQLNQFHEMNIGTIISEKNKSEAIINSIQDGLVVMNTDLIVSGINPAARMILGLENAEIINCSFSEFFAESVILNQIKAALEDNFQTGVADEPEIFTTEKDMQTRHYLYSVMAVKGKNGRPYAIILVLRDVTRLKELEKLKSDFIMAASHELRTPLTSLGMSIELLMESTNKALKAKEQELLNTAFEEIQRMKALVNDLLDLSKMEAGKIELEFEHFPINILFKQVATIFKSQLGMKGVTMTSEIPENLPGVKADANKIAWILTNLISNALRYTEKDGHIKLQAAKVSDCIQISVQDDGPGIPSEYQSRIFQKFVQVKGRPSGGTGLGLSICREIVKAHGGAIWVDSSPGHGSTFTFSLPVWLKEGKNE